MTPIDWIITVLPALLALSVGFYCKRFLRSVADFTSGGRSAGRFLLAIANGELQAGAVVFVALFEIIQHAGFTYTWWTWLTIPAGILVSISGFVVYRFRETRALTMAQFFELRYSKSFRLCAGGFSFLAGILNFGIIPSVGARCLAYFWGLPENLHLLSLTVPTYVPLMGAFICVDLFVVLTGGLVTVMIINCLEGIISQLFYIIIIVTLLMLIDWSQIVAVLTSRPHGQSLLVPADSSGIKDFNITYVLMQLAVGIYATNAWQNAAGYQSAGYTAHESRMGMVLSRWRELGKAAVIVVMGVCALTFLNHPHFAAQNVAVTAQLHRISNPKMQSQMTMTIALSHLLPVGVKGVLCAIFLMGLFGGDATHLHSWGSIFVQDLLVPLRKKPFGVRQHITVLRCSIIGVACFAFIFGSLFRNTGYVVMWWTITSGIYVAGAGSAIVGGLYWKKGTTAGAFTALLAGSVLCLSGIIAQQVFPNFPMNGQEVSFSAALIAISLYVGVSLLTCREDFNLERMLHRGRYAVIKTQVGDAPLPVKKKQPWRDRLIGIDENFSRGDKWTAGLLLGWSLFLFCTFLVISIWNFFRPWTVAAWASFWHIIGFGIPILFAVGTGIWFTWGGVKGMGEFFQRLRAERTNHFDDGTVKDHQNLDERVLTHTAVRSEDDPT